MNNMAQLYEEMKLALAYFGVKFHDMHKVTFRIVNDEIVFSYEDRHIVIKVTATT